MSFARTCLQICKLLSGPGLFSSTKNESPSFSDTHAKVGHDLDEVMFKIHKQISFAERVQRYNPEPANEIKTFQALPPIEKGNMLVRNALLLSRVFIENAQSVKLNEIYLKNEKIKILDVGCGSAPTLIGILALFGTHRVEYTGIDVDEKAINENKKSFSAFKDINFVTDDACKFLQQEENKNTFDLILIQHPNIELYRKIFAEIYQHADKVLKPGGYLYSTFYYAAEAKFFRDEIRPKMATKKGVMIFDAQRYKHSLLNRHTGETYQPENHLFLSKPKEGLGLKFKAL